jgi:hypothetical protein
MKTFKKILLAIFTLPLLGIVIFVTSLWGVCVLAILPFILFFDWLKDDLFYWSSDWWKIFIVPFLLYLEGVWDIDLL